MTAHWAQPTTPAVGKGTAERHRPGGQPHAPRRGAPPGRRWAAALGVAGLLVLGACGSGGGSADVRCSAGQCRAVVSGTPVEVSEPSGAGSMALVMGTSTSRPKPTTSKSSSSRPTTRPTTRTPSRDRDDVDFVVRAVGPGWVEVDDDGVQRLAVGQVFAEDDRVVRVESADGRTAVFVWPAAV
ncbi:hypothetical protein [Actinomycetospora soli]|uniref:hypothetical protein n=1 Tax=Actinomycetospora soli TaxID=2893887 RepID=UPI001E579607|nr:hypothetical protein [Actinomycetospora soli]MCD2187566.1 hypothetical protein [Actinomycetospora soli]